MLSFGNTICAPKFLPGPNLHFRFMKNSIHTSLSWSLVPTIYVSENLDTGERTQTSNLLWVSLNSSEL